MRGFVSGLGAGALVSALAVVAASGIAPMWLPEDIVGAPRAADSAPQIASDDVDNSAPASAGPSSDDTAELSPPLGDAGPDAALPSRADDRPVTGTQVEPVAEQERAEAARRPEQRQDPAVPEIEIAPPQKDGSAQDTAQATQTEPRYGASERGTAPGAAPDDRTGLETAQGQVASEADADDADDADDAQPMSPDRSAGASAPARAGVEPEGPSSDDERAVAALVEDPDPGDEPDDALDGAEEDAPEREGADDAAAALAEDAGSDADPSAAEIVEDAAADDGTRPTVVSDATPRPPENGPVVSSPSGARGFADVETSGSEPSAPDIAAPDRIGAAGSDPSRPATGPVTRTDTPPDADATPSISQAPEALPVERPSPSAPNATPDAATDDVASADSDAAVLDRADDAPSAPLRPASGPITDPGQAPGTDAAPTMATGQDAPGVARQSPTAPAVATGDDTASPLPMAPDRSARDMALLERPPSLASQSRTDGQTGEGASDKPQAAFSDQTTDAMSSAPRRPEMVLADNAGVAPGADMAPAVSRAPVGTTTERSAPSAPNAATGDTVADGLPDRVSGARASVRVDAPEPPGDARLAALSPPLDESPDQAAPERPRADAAGEDTAPDHFGDAPQPQPEPGTGDLPQIGGDGLAVNRGEGPGGDAGRETEMPDGSPKDGTVANGPALERNAVPFDGGGAPLFSILLIDRPDGPLLATPQMTVAIPLDMDGAAERAELWRAAGQEVVAILPQGGTPDLRAALDALPLATAVLPATPGGFAGATAGAQETLAVLAETGHGVLSWGEGLDPALRLAQQSGIAAAEIYRRVDGEGRDARAIARFLDQAAFQARTRGTAIVIAANRPDAIEAIDRWRAGRRAGQVDLAPVSAILTRE